MGLSTREGFGRALVEAGRRFPNLVVLEADLGKSTRSEVFARQFPDRYYNLGVAEQNEVGVAAGMASLGLIPFACSLAIFSAQRSCNQVYVAVAYPRLNVKVVGTHCGLQASGDGPSHQAINDIAIMRSMPHMAVLVPADGVEAAQATVAAAEWDGPLYLRLGRDDVPQLFADGYRFVIGEGVTLREGRDLTLVSTGAMTHQAMAAAQRLEREQGVRARVLHLPTVKPLAREAVLAAAEETPFLITLEEHSILGGLGGAVCELLAAEHPTRVYCIGLRDTFAESGGTAELFEAFGLGVGTIMETAMQGLRVGPPVTPRS